jgi:CheY-like chemotaxis protein
MPNQPLTLFIVDDEPVARAIAQEELTTLGHRLIEFPTGVAALEALDQAPDIVLLDIEMPGLDGIAVCRALREKLGETPQVIFISGHDDLETRLLAYDAGGDDYVVKPYDAEELARKVVVAERALADKRQLAAQANLARNAAFTAMSSMGEMGTVLEFLRASFGCTTPAELARALFTVLGQYGLHGFTELRLGEVGECHSSNQTACTALEVSILGHARKTDRLFQFRDRLAINYPSVTLLLTDLPLDDPERLGRYRDHLAIMAEGMESRLRAMHLERQRTAQADAIVAAVAELTGMLAEIETRQGMHRLRLLELGTDYLEQLNNAFIHLGLTEGQEAELIGMARAAHERVSDLLGDDKSLGEHLGSVADALRHLSGQSSHP